MHRGTSLRSFGKQQIPMQLSISNNVVTSFLHQIHGSSHFTHTNLTLKLVTLFTLVSLHAQTSLMSKSTPRSHFYLPWNRRYGQLFSCYRRKNSKKFPGTGFFVSSTISNTFSFWLSSTFRTKKCFCPPPPLMNVAGPSQINCTGINIRP